MSTGRPTMKTTGICGTPGTRTVATSPTSTPTTPTTVRHLTTGPRSIRPTSSRSGSPTRRSTTSVSKRLLVTSSRAPNSPHPLREIIPLVAWGDLPMVVVVVAEAATKRSDFILILQCSITISEWAVWPDKNRQMSIKVAQNDFTSKSNRFWHLYENCLRMWEIWEN